jgi:hypothetical protein
MRTRISTLAALALALAACRGDAKTPPAQQQTAAPKAAGRLTLSLGLPQQPGWNATDTVVVTLANGSAAPVGQSVLRLFVQAPVAALVDSAGPPPRPMARANQAGTWIAFPLSGVAAGQTVEIRQAIRTPPAPAPAAPPVPGQPKRAETARTDTATSFRIAAELSTPDQGSLLTAPAEDTLRIRPGSAVVVGGCGNVNDAVVTRYGIGPVRVGMPVDALRSACPEARDTAWKGQEGMKETGLVVAPGGRRVLAVTADSTVNRIVIDQPGLQTAAGVGVGAAVADLRARFGRMCSGAGEGQVAVWFPNQPGLSFGLDTAATKGWTPARMNPDSVPDDVKVTSMWVRKGSDDCPARPGEGGR